MYERMKQLKVLILSSSGGAGHLRAAEALHRTAQSIDLPIKTENHDCLDFTSPTFKRLYGGTYLGLVNKTPELWGYLYGKAEAKPYRKSGLIRLFDHFNYNRYLRFLKSSKPDAIICTHFLPFISISSEIRKWGIEAPIFAATTDFDVHQYWVDPIVYRYYVFHEESLWQLQSKGIPVHRISVAGIPVMPEFLTKTSRREAKRSLGLDERTFTILVLSGGFGVGHFEDIVRSIGETLAGFPRRQFSLIVVCGKNTAAKASIGTMRFPQNVHTSIHGFVTNIAEMMSASDLVVTKSGGLTSSEALVKCLPMLIVDPIPGQEMRNADLIVEHGAGWKAINLANLAYKLKKILKNPSMLTNAHKASSTLARPHAARDILTDVYRNIQPRKEIMK
jgi:processive 1,2-diacylglycerol beta-glucosyltransferase